VQTPLGGQTQLQIPSSVKPCGTLKAHGLATPSFKHALGIKQGAERGTRGVVVLSDLEEILITNQG
jgi:hypothetical protein